MFDPKDNPPLDDFKPVTLITDGDPMTVADYLACVECGGFIDYDGFGHPATSTHEDERFTVIPSLGKACIPPNATHVAWYNR